MICLLILFVFKFSILFLDWYARFSLQKFSDFGYPLSRSWFKQSQYNYDKPYKNLILILDWHFLYWFTWQNIIWQIQILDKGPFRQNGSKFLILKSKSNPQQSWLLYILLYARTVTHVHLKYKCTLFLYI